VQTEHRNSESVLSRRSFLRKSALGAGSAAVAGSLLEPWLAPAGARGTASAARLAATTIDATKFASAAELRNLVAKLVSLGLRSPGSTAHNHAIAFLENQLRAIPGLKIHSDYYTIDRWQPLAHAPGGRLGRDLARSGDLRIDHSGSVQTAPVIGAVPFSLPTSTTGHRGQLVYIAPGQSITPANAKGKIVLIDVAPAPVAYAELGLIAYYRSPGSPTTGNYDRPYARDLNTPLFDAGVAQAAGVVYLWEAPTDQLKGYWDPHAGTRYRVPAVFVGSDHASRLKQLAATGATANVVVRAKWDRAPTRNLLATLTGETRERIIVNSHTDGLDWVQENGTAGVIALARYLARLPRSHRHRDIEFALTSSHLAYRYDGTVRLAAQLNKEYPKGTVAFVISMEHMGTREILPSGPSNRLHFTGKPELTAWSAPEESPVLVNASVAAVKRHKLHNVSVLKGVEVPVADRVPQFCSQGGIGTNFNSQLIPTISTITGPWSLWAPSFGEHAVDFDRMRAEVLALGDVVRGLDRVPRAQIAGTYIQERRERAQGSPTCDVTPPPRVAPKH
jgi:hypothetical protein